MTGRRRFDRMRWIAGLAVLVALALGSAVALAQTTGEVSSSLDSLRADTEAMQAHGHMPMSEMKAFADKLARLWNPNCQAEAAAGIRVKVHFRLNRQGRLIGSPDLVGGNGSDPLEARASARALSAVERGQPYSDVLNPAHYAAWRDVVVSFDARQACAQK
jgi:hypothetical protein